MDEIEMPAFKPVTVEMSFDGVDPEVLGLLTGGVLGTPPPPVFSVDVAVPIKRTFWQWLRRKPKRYRRIVIPNARVVSVSGNGEA